MSTISFGSEYAKFQMKNRYPKDNTLSVQLIPTTYPLVWKTPRELLWSIIKNTYYFPKTKSSLGHVTAEISCTIKGTKIDRFMGQTVKDLHAFRNKIKQGYGFSILNSPGQYSDLPLVNVPGKLDVLEDSQQRFDRLIKKDHLLILAFKISESECSKIDMFMQEYERKTKETKLAGNIYGFGANPLKFEGAGCAPFVQSIFELAELNSFAGMMNKHVWLSESILGHPQQGKKVSLWSILAHQKNISLRDEKSRNFSFPDPQNLVDYVYREVGGNPSKSTPVIEKTRITGEKSWFLYLDSL